MTHAPRPLPAFAGATWWSRHPWPRHLVEAALPPLPPPILIMSLPRSGSSWVAEIMGAAKEALFLREPINQGHLAAGGATTVFDIDPASPPPHYAMLAARAFGAIPVFPAGCVRDTAQWGLRRRTQRHALIKEVNPLALEWLLAIYRPRVIFLVRHPAAVARSYEKLNWLNAEDKLAELGERLMQRHLHPWRALIDGASGFWQAHGVFQGAVHHVAMEILKDHPDHRIATYESLCAAPETGFQALFEFAGLTFDETIRTQIAEHAGGPGRHDVGTYGTRRNTHEMAVSWKSRLSGAQLAALRSGYTAFDGAYYRQADDWNPAAT